MQIIDNISSLLGDDLKETLKPGAKVRIAASCFSIYAYEALKAELEQIQSLEFIFTSPSFLPGEVTDKIRKERREFHIPKFADERFLSGTEFEIRLRNQLTQKAIARECADWINRKATFKSNNSAALMQQFAVVKDETSESVYFPIQGFSAVELGYEKGNAVSNFVHRDDNSPITKKYLELFDDIWHSPSRLVEVTDTICDHISTVYQENSPERIYFLMLYNIFNEFLDDINEDLMPNERTGYQNSVVWKTLYNFQRDAAVGIINKLETFNGCILADSVGLGKTFTALAVIKYYELRNKSVLVLCPKKLAENWLTYNSPLKTNVLIGDRLGYTVLNHTDLQRTSGLSHGLPLNQINWGNFDLVVIDESHNFRNANPGEEEKESRYDRLMNHVVRAGVKTKVLMLSATPVNNNFGDLKNQLALAYEGESENLQAKIGTKNSIDEIFSRAKGAFTRWTNLPAEERTPEAILESLDFEFFKVLDCVTIARSRKHIEAHYDTAEIGTFPERRPPIAYRTPLTNLADVDTYNEIYDQLSKVTLACYTPAYYLLASRREKYDSAFGDDNLSLAGQQKGIRSLMTVNLLKRLESSVHAFRITLGKVRNNIGFQLDNIRKFESGTNPRATTGGKLPYSFDPENDDFPDSLDSEDAILLSDLDLESWKRDLENDLSVAEILIAEMEKVTPEHDAKLQHLISQIQKKVENPINPGNRKILLFTAFSDTANYLYENLTPAHLSRFSIHSAKITGTDKPKTTLGHGFDFQTLLTYFSPLSKKKSLIFPDDNREIDLLIATDCISEGQNLQDCDYLINYDIHWNPVRIIQRFGRIDRIGSKNPVIQLVNYWPDISLDEYINLRERVENRMVIVDMAGTGADNVLNPRANEMQYRKEQLRKLQSEVIEMEDLRTGISITDLGLNDFRMDLVSFIKQEGDLSRVPNGLHAIVPADASRGLHPGTIFALRNRHETVNLNHANRLHPYYLVYIRESGETLINHTEVKRILDICRTACKGHSAPFSQLCRTFNKATNDGREMTRYSSLLDQAIRTMVQHKEESDVDSLFSPGKTSALVGDIAGLDDFELIAFIIVQPNQ